MGNIPPKTTNVPKSKSDTETTDEPEKSTKTVQFSSNDDHIDIPEELEDQTEDDGEEKELYREEYEEEYDEEDYDDESDDQDQEEVQCVLLGDSDCVRQKLAVSVDIDLFMMTEANFNEATEDPESKE